MYNDLVSADALNLLIVISFVRRRLILQVSICQFCFFSPKNLASSHHLKGYFSKVSYRGNMPPDPLSVARLPTQSTAATKESKGNTVLHSTKYCITTVKHTVAIQFRDV